jgi:monoamine oxidase
MNTTVTKYTTLPQPLQKIIPMNSEKGIYMISYNDNANTEQLKSCTENTAHNRAFFEKELEKALALNTGILKLEEIKAYYWEIGTHCYKPMDENVTIEQYLHHIQHPVKNRALYVVGETVSNDHGWCEGALNSVERIMHYL